MIRTPLALLFFAAAAFAQDAPAAADPLQALLAEVHQLRLDLQATTVTAQRVQILLYRVQLQQSNTIRAMAHADEMHGRFMNAQQTRSRTAQDLQRTQEMAAATTDPQTVKALQMQLADAKSQVEMWQNEEQQWQAKEVEAQSQVRAEQAKLDSLQETLDRLDKTLASLAKP